MVKKKRKPQPRKSKTTQANSVLSFTKKIFVFAFAVVVCFIGVLFIYNWFFPLSKADSVKKKQERVVAKDRRLQKSEQKQIRKPQRKVEQEQTNTLTSYAFPADVEIPTLKNKQKEQIIKHEGYTVSYNSDYKIANWVAYELTSKEATSQKNERSNKFVPDPMVKGASATNGDYTRTGYDRGHLAPAGDMKWSAKAMRESFYLSNICPQKPGLNRGVWKELEEQSRLWAKENGSLFVITGPVYKGEMKRIGKNRVGVPETFYKVLCMKVNGKIEGVGFLFDNKDYGKTSLRSKMISIDSVEKATGIDFFPTLPDSIERELESKVNYKSWSF